MLDIALWALGGAALGCAILGCILLGVYGAEARRLTRRARGCCGEKHS